MGNLLYKIPAFRRGASIVYTENEVTAENVFTGKKYRLERKVKHPRTLASDFFQIESEIKEIISNLIPGRFIKPKILICLIGQSEGGYTNIERRAFKEAGYSAGAFEVYLAEK